MKMAVSSCKKDLHEFAVEESCCPVCLEEFREPKSLPNCLHNVCEKCLQGIAKGQAPSSPIKCPVCRKQSRLPVGGVCAMPTNRLLVRLIDKTHKNQGKQDTKPSIEETKKKLHLTKRSLERIEQASALLQASKAEISSRAGKLVAIIKEQEKRLHAEVDGIIEGWDKTMPKAKRKVITESIQQFTSCINNIELKHGASSENNKAVMDLCQAMLIQLEEFNKAIPLQNCKVSQPGFIYNSMVEKFLSETIFGKLTLDTESSQQLKAAAVTGGKGVGSQETQSGGAQGTQSGGAQGTQSANGVEKRHHQNSQAGCQCASVAEGAVGGRTFQFKRFGKEIRTVGAQDAGVNSFTPVGIAVSHASGDIAVLTEENRVHIIWEEDLSPNWFFNIKYGELYDIAYSLEEEIVVVNRENHRLLHYDGEDGTFIRKFVNSDGWETYFCGLSIDDDGRLIVCCNPEEDEWFEEMNGTEESVLVFDCNRDFQFGFGGGKLSDPEKAVFFNEEFFVNDTEDIKVFDAFGRYVRKFGSFKTARGLAINPIDDINAHILVCDEESNTVQIYSQNGSFVAQCHTNNRPRSVAVTRSGLIAVACQWGECIQFISYSAG